MKAYIGIKFHLDYKNQKVVDAISSILESKGYETICIIRDYVQKEQIKYAPQELMKLTFELIDLCDLVVIDLTEKGVGLGIEAGYAFAKGIPIITVAKNGSDISETLDGISKDIYIYDTIESLNTLLYNLELIKMHRTYILGY